MTLRVNLEVIPFGVESDAYDIMYMDISNIGEIENKGFGHSVCRYSWTVYRPVLPILRDADGPTHEAEDSGTVIHDRRDGAWVLVQKAINDLEKIDA